MSRLNENFHSRILQKIGKEFPRRKSAVVLLVGLFWICYVAFTLGFYVHNSANFYQEHMSERKENLDFVMDLSAHFLLVGQPQVLLRRLNLARERKLIDFYILKRQDQVLGFYNFNNDLQGLNFDIPPSPNFIELPSSTLKSIVADDLKLVVGFNKNETQFIISNFWQQRLVIFKDILFVTLIALAVVYFVLRDFLKLSKILQSRHRGFRQVQVLSSEANTILNASKGYADSQLDLRQNNQNLSESLGSAITNEIASQRQPPYSVKCTVARVDLNGYTQLFLSQRPDQLHILLNEYFRRSREVINRYGGEIYQIIGDEMVILFKDKAALPNSLRRGLATIRNLFALAESIHCKEMPEGLKLKASLAPGVLQFVRLDRGHCFSGLPLIETVRMLGQVSEKSESRLILFEENLAAVTDLCNPLQGKTTVLKGFKDTAHLVEIRDFTPVDSFSDLEEKGELFRSDQEILSLLKNMQEQLKEGEEENFFRIVKSLQSLVIRNSIPGLSEAFLHLLSSFNNTNPSGSRPSLAATVGLVKNLFPGGSVDRRLFDQLQEIFRLKDARLRSNLLESLEHLGLGPEDLREEFISDSNRLAGQAILIAGKRNFDREILNQIRKMLNSKQPEFQKTGRYVTKELCRYYEKVDTVHALANPHLQELRQLLVNLSDENITLKSTG